jgi:hypothetical protein
VTERRPPPDRSWSSPDLDLVVVITADAGQQREDGEELVAQTIVPAVS